MSFKKHKFIQALQTALIVISGAGFGWTLGILSNQKLISIIPGTTLGIFAALKLKTRAKKVLAIILTVPCTIIMVAGFLIAVTQLNDYLKLQKPRTYYIQEASFSFKLSPGWQAKAVRGAAVLPYFFDLGGGYKDSPNKTVTLIQIQTPLPKDTLKDNGGSIEILEGNAVSNSSSEFEKVYNVKGSNFTVDGNTGIKLASYDDIDKLEIKEYLFYLPKSNKTARFYYARKQNAKPLEVDFENLVRSTDF